MSSTRRTLIMMIAAATLSLAPARASAPEINPWAGVVNLDERLAALSPDNPIAYFELAEEVAYEMPDVGGRRLARHLYVLAFEADRNAPRPLGLGRSVCIALADMSTQPDERRWLFALAAVLGDTTTSVNWDPQIRDATSTETAMALAEALGYFRAMDYRKAHRLLIRDDVEALFNQYDHVVEQGRDINFMTTDAIGCPECRNSRVVRSGGTRENPYRLCATCGGNPGPRLSGDEFLAQLRLESVLLNANHHSWSAQVTVDGGEPLRDVEPDELAASFSVDPTRFYWHPGTRTWEVAPAPAEGM
ncbi:MAG: hypothetical protein KDA21_06315 [Phycisphaerales bacterium]|nr:hypothetical protein [Phycisphaerales bacterium]